MNTKRIFALLLALSMALSLAACDLPEQTGKIQGDTNFDGSIERGQDGV